MSGATDIDTGIGVSSWGWETDDMTPILGGKKTELRKWRVSKRNELQFYISLPVDKDACDALILACALIRSDNYELVMEGWTK